MKTWFEKDTVVGGVQAKRMLAAGDDWQIYKAAGGEYILAVSRTLAEGWADYHEADSLFTAYEHDGNILTFVSGPGALVSSLAKGPFPTTRTQIECFDNACVKLRREHPDAAFSGALYIEERSLILPADPNAAKADDALSIGAWITGGVRIPITDTAAVHRLASWFPEEVLTRIASDSGAAPGAAAGTRIRGDEARAETDVRTEDSVRPVSDRRAMPDEPFSIPGSSKLEKFFNEEIVEIVRHADEYKRMGIGFPGAAVLYGPPGTGKTFAVEKLADYLGWPRYEINSDSVGSTYIHETGMKIARIFDMAIANAPSVVVIDEMESFLSGRAAQQQHQVEEVAEFLRKIPEANEKGVLIFGMTNVIDEIDPAILRRGRFDYLIKVDYADKKDIRELLEAKKKDIPIDGGADLDRLARDLAGHPMSDVVFVLREAGKYAVKNRCRTITDDAFKAALAKLPGAREARNRIGFSVLDR